jgi:hypothetical protein
MITTVRKFIDYARQANRQRLYKRRGRKLKHLEKLDVQSRFEYIFESNYWGNAESKSGNGSTLESTKTLRPELEVLLRDLKVETFLDAPCGDWNWMQAVRFPPGMRYIGGDIVLPMIEALSKKYGSERVAFSHMNIIETPFPAADVWMCRDSLFHLSNQDIGKTLRNFLRSGTPYALLTSMPGVRLNEDIMTGSYRPLNLMGTPFGFPEPRRVLRDSPVHEKLRYLGLWHRDDLAPLIEG